jgi:hypothetical protein
VQLSLRQEIEPQSSQHLPCRLAPSCSRHERWRAVPGRAQSFLVFLANSPALASGRLAPAGSRPERGASVSLFAVRFCSVHANCTAEGDYQIYRFGVLKKYFTSCDRNQNYHKSKDDLLVALVIVWGQIRDEVLRRFRTFARLVFPLQRSILRSILHARLECVAPALTFSTCDISPDVVVNLS